VDRVPNPQFCGPPQQPHLFPGLCSVLNSAAKLFLCIEGDVMVSSCHRPVSRAQSLLATLPMIIGYPTPKAALFMFNSLQFPATSSPSGHFPPTSHSPLAYFYYRSRSLPLLIFFSPRAPFLFLHEQFPSTALSVSPRAMPISVILKSFPTASCTPTPLPAHPWIHPPHSLSPPEKTVCPPPSRSPPSSLIQDSFAAFLPPHMVFFFFNYIPSPLPVSRFSFLPFDILFIVDPMTDGWSLF